MERIIVMFYMNIKCIQWCSREEGGRLKSFPNHFKTDKKQRKSIKIKIRCAQCINQNKEKHKQFKNCYHLTVSKIQNRKLYFITKLLKVKVRCNSSKLQCMLRLMLFLTLSFFFLGSIVLFFLGWGTGGMSYRVQI